jgi:hypothetical protein
MLFQFGFTVIKPPPQPAFPALNAGQKKFKNRPVAPIRRDKKPFGENLEGPLLVALRRFSCVGLSSIRCRQGAGYFSAHPSTLSGACRFGGSIGSIVPATRLKGGGGAVLD